MHKCIAFICFLMKPFLWHLIYLQQFYTKFSLMQHTDNPLNIFVHHTLTVDSYLLYGALLFVFWCQTNYKISRTHTYIPLWASRKEFPGYQWQHQTLLHKADATMMAMHTLGEKPFVPLWWCESLSSSSTVCTPEFLTPQQQSQRGLLFLYVYYQILASSSLFFHFISIQAALQGYLK